MRDQVYLTQQVFVETMHGQASSTDLASPHQDSTLFEEHRRCIVSCW